MKQFWKSVGSAAAKLAIYALGHPDAVIAVVQDIKAVRAA